jgi:hypothetical protein
VPVIPDPAVAISDGPLTYKRDGCGDYDPRKSDRAGCVFGDPHGSRMVALVGDSHAGQFATPMDAVAKDQGWQLHTMVRNGCPFTAAPQLMGGAADHDCADANAVTRDELLRLHPALVVVSAMKPLGYQRGLGWGWSSDAAIVAGYRQLWAPLVAAGIHVLVIRDLPYPNYVDPECVEQHGPTSPVCSMARSAVDHQPDPQLEAARGMQGVSVLDLTDHFCNAQSCPGVLGNVLVYRDNHITDTLSLSLIPAMENALTPLV